ncbi:hypothetical protein [Thermomonospora amylolytica]|uniref:hypothetical protein n=1 Tax=Thermomonospora amylolytica TaxID=1411117 RepID=UPI000E6C0EB0|nr:hypothetical protein [Thermomonospora amylolytica]
MTRFQPGEIVNITIKGVRIARPRSATAVTITDEHGVTYQMPPQAAVEPVAPAEWPPQVGDVWRDHEGDLWFTQELLEENGSQVVFAPAQSGEYGHSDADPDDALRRYGPMTLVYRKLVELDGGESR